MTTRVSVRRSMRTFSLTKPLTAVSIVCSISPLYGFFVSRLWNHVSTVERIVIVLCYISIFIPVLFVVVPWRKCIAKYVLGRKAILFSKKNIRPLKDIISNVDSAIPCEESLSRIQSEVKVTVDKICTAVRNSFGGSVFTYQLCGSAAERYGTPLWLEQSNVQDVQYMDALITDFDFMIYPRDMAASFTFQEMFRIVTEQKDIKPGFAKVYCNATAHMWPPLKPVISNNNELSAKEVKNKLYQALLDCDVSHFPGFKNYWFNFGSTEHLVHITQKGVTIKIESGNSMSLVNGPVGPVMVTAVGASCTNLFLADMTFGIPCKDWPPISDWVLSKSERHWPDAAVVARISQHGCHLVPKSQEGDEDHVTWRFSFSQAEVELSKVVPAAARKCFVALKIVLKDHLSYACDKLKSYHLKTLFLHKLQRSDPNYWRQEDLEPIFMSLLQDLQTAVTNRTCPHFWISSINLFEDFSQKNVNKLTRSINVIVKNPGPYIENRYANLGRGLSAACCMNDLYRNFPYGNSKEGERREAGDEVSTAAQQSSNYGSLGSSHVHPIDRNGDLLV